MNFVLTKLKINGKYKQFKNSIQKNIIIELFDKEINNGQIKIRESNDISIRKFISTKMSNMRDYTDACCRYLRSTGLINISKGRSLSITKEKIPDVEFILSTIDRNPILLMMRNNIQKFYIIQNFLYYIQTMTMY